MQDIPHAKGNGSKTWWESALCRVEVYFGLSPSEQEALRSELVAVLHASFMDHPAYDAEHLPEFLGADLYLRVFIDGQLAGLFTSDLLRTGGEPVLYLSAGFVLPGKRSGGALMSHLFGLTLDLAAQAFGSDEFFVALRTANPRVVAKLWQSPWVCFYPRPDWELNDPRLLKLTPKFCSQVFGADRCSMSGRIFYDIYPTVPWKGAIPWYHDERVNNFCRAHLRPGGRDAFLFLGPTLPPLEGIPRGEVAWPKGLR